MPAVAEDLGQGRREGAKSVPLGQRERGRGPEGVNKPELLPDGPKVCTYAPALLRDFSDLYLTFLLP